ncbi:MAG: hypothetical protein EXS49_00855 [Candidatus Pacebacteria bacterium]|nr:hypothetical protein [Candidatus Paceibacterota bacterium]
MNDLIIPSINCTTFEEAKEKIFKCRDFLPGNGWVHIDVSDGSFSPAFIWGNAEEFRTLIDENVWMRKINFEVHLMIQNPEKVFLEWISAGVSRIIAHHETIIDSEFLIKKCAENDVDLMISIKPETNVSEFKKYSHKVDKFQILAVSPGWAGQLFKIESLEKIKELRKMFPDCFIEVDGGINLETIRYAKSSGSNAYVVAHFLWELNPPEIGYVELQNALR